MHAITYQLKRAHLSALAIGRRIFRGTKPPEDPDFDGVPDMTPARFDILVVVYGRKVGRLPPPRHIGMAELVRRLGLARATISKAIKRLAELGLVTCSPIEEGRRGKVVYLTDEGISRLKRALHLVFTGRALARHFRRFAAQRCSSETSNLAWHVNEELEHVRNEVRAVARHLFDRSEDLYYIRVADDC